MSLVWCRTRQSTPGQRSLCEHPSQVQVTQVAKTVNNQNFGVPIVLAIAWRKFDRCELAAKNECKPCLSLAKIRHIPAGVTGQRSEEIELSGKPVNKKKRLNFTDFYNFVTKDARS